MGNEEIELSEFPGQAEEDRKVNPHYFNSDLPLKNFENPEAIWKEVDQFISGQKLHSNISMGKKLRRRRHRWEKQKILKGARYRENTKCLVCGERTQNV